MITASVITGSDLLIKAEQKGAELVKRTGRTVPRGDV